MKKLLNILSRILLCCLLTALLLLPPTALILFLSSSVFAAGPTAVVVTMDKTHAWELSGDNWQAVYRIKAIISVDGSDTDEFLLSTYDTSSVLPQVSGGALYMIHIGPGSDAPDTDAVTIGFDGELGEDWLSVTTASLTSKVEKFSGESNVVWSDIQIDLPDIGSSGDDIIIYFTIFK